MAVSGWTTTGSKQWQGSNAAGIRASDGGGSGSITKLSWDLYDGQTGDWEFETSITTQANGNWDVGCFNFCQQGQTTGYTIHWFINWQGINFRMFKDNNNGASSSGTEIGTAKFKNDTSISFDFKVIKTGSVYELFHSSVSMGTWTDGTYSDGDIGYGYPESQWNGGYSVFTNASVTVVGGGGRRIFLVT